MLGDLFPYLAPHIVECQSLTFQYSIWTWNESFPSVVYQFSYQHFCGPLTSNTCSRSFRVCFVALRRLLRTAGPGIGMTLAQALASSRIK